MKKRSDWASGPKEACSGWRREISGARLMDCCCPGLFKVVPAKRVAETAGWRRGDRLQSRSLVNSRHWMEQEEGRVEDLRHKINQSERPYGRGLGRPEGQRSVEKGRALGMMIRVMEEL